MSKKGLGKGLDALIPKEISSEITPNNVDISKIKPTKSQPRKNFDEKTLNELAKSIKENGLIQPIVVRKKGNNYEIIAGERRWRAAQKAGIKKLPIIIKDASDLNVLELALIENLQREDLNPIEEAEAFNQLIEDFNLTHEEVSKKIGKDRSTVTNQVRLLQLTNKSKNALITKKISAGHARALLSIENKNEIDSTLDQIIKANLSVRKTEHLIKKINSEKNKKIQIKKEQQGSLGKNIFLENLTDEMTRALGTKVKIKQIGDKGKIEIEYYSSDELDRLIGMILSNR